MRHLRIHSSATKTFCREPVNAHPSTPIEDQATEDPALSDCVPCLGQAVLLHETQARLAEDRLTEIARHADEERENHQYISAGDTPAADGSIAYVGCFICGKPRNKHKEPLVGQRTR